jgi:myo-inositol-1(or 4)-monophosphatase
MYYAETGKGATCNGKAIRTSKEHSLKNVLFSYATDFSDEPEKTKYETDILSEIIQNVRNIRATNCLVDFCYVADGRLGGNINHSTKIWDIVAPYLIIREAGGVMSDLDGQDIEFDLTIDNYLRNYAVIACGRQFHESLVGMVAKYQKS